MDYQIIAENEWATMRYHPGDRYIYHTFHKPLSGAPFRAIMNLGLDALIENGAEKWLSDDRKNAEFPADDVEYALTDWGPRAAQGGWKYWALVVPEDIAGRAGMQDIVGAFFNFGVIVKVFVDLDEARNWLVNQ